MQDINFIKAKATAAVEYLAGQGIEVKHGVILEMLSRLEGYRNWSTFREQLAVTPAASNPPTVQQALTMCYRWLSSAPLDKLEVVEGALGERAPVTMAAEALKATDTSHAVDTPQSAPASWSAAMGPMDEAQYVALDGLRCPSCGSREVYARELDIDGPTAWQQATCEECGATWVDTLKLATYSELEGGIDREAVASVVEDVKSRAREYGFSISNAAQAREAVDESCDLIEPQMSEAERKLAVQQLAG